MLSMRPGGEGPAGAYLRQPSYGLNWTQDNLTGEIGDGNVLFVFASVLVRWWISRSACWNVALTSAR